jgi:hypothetical protein
MLWNHRNRCVFDKNPPNLGASIRKVEEEKDLWGLAGARNLALPHSWPIVVKCLS